MSEELEAELRPLPAFRFAVTFKGADLGGKGGGELKLCHGAFSECTGLEATMEPRAIEEGGRNQGAHQRVGRVTYGTVILKRGVTLNRDLWRWWNKVQTGAYHHRITVEIQMLHPDGSSPAPWKWTLTRCLPVKFKAPDLNATSGEVAVEEIHLVHEGITFKEA